MDASNIHVLSEQLMKSNPVFRQLATEHKKYESRLDELSALHYPNEEEQKEEAFLKKKKLAVKDQMHAILGSHEPAEKIQH